MKTKIAVDAIKWTGKNINEVLDFGNSGPLPLWGADFRINREEETVELLDATQKARKGDWIMRDKLGYFVVIYGNYKPLNP